MTSRLRVLVVDDSAFARKVLREILAGDPRIEVVGFARDGLDALEKIAELSPDVITLDLVMPELDGVGVLRALAQTPKAPQAVIVTMTEAESVLGILALEAGGFDLVHKPTALATDRLYELSHELVEKVVAAGSVRASTPRALANAPVPAARASKAVRSQLVVIGASTGGPRALAEILAALPADFPVPIAAVVHMPPGYTEAFAARLDGNSPLQVREASAATPLTRGSVVIARAGAHLRIRRSGRDLFGEIDPRAGGRLHQPSVDVLFESAAEALDDAVVGVVLTGMGNDGLEGARAIHARGGRLLVEAESSCVVYGMPRAVAEAELDAKSFPLADMAAAIAANA